MIYFLIGLILYSIGFAHFLCRKDILAFRRLLKNIDDVYFVRKDGNDIFYNIDTDEMKAKIVVSPFLKIGMYDEMREDMYTTLFTPILNYRIIKKIEK